MCFCWEEENTVVNTGTRMRWGSRNGSYENAPHSDSRDQIRAQIKAACSVHKLIWSYFANLGMFMYSSADKSTTYVV